MATADSAVTDAPALPTIDQALDKAFEGVDPGGTEGTDDVGEEAGAEGAEGSDTTDGDTSAEEAEGAEEQTVAGQAPPVKAPEAADTVPEYLQGSGNALLAEQWNKFTPEQKTYVQQVITPKFQEIAAGKKFIQAFADDPEAAANEVLTRLGVQRRAEAQTEEEQVASVAASIEKDLVEGGIDPAAAKIQARALAKSQHALTAPIRQQAAADRLRSIATQAEQETSRFQTEFPDSKDDQPIGQRIFELMDSLQPNGIDNYSYLKLLRSIAVSESGVSAGVNKSLKTMAKGAKAAAAAAGSQKPVGDGVVKPGMPPGKLPSIEEAFAGAQRGEVWGRAVKR